VLAAFFLWRQRDIKRLFAYSSIEHMGIVTFAFGMGGAVANFAALLHMTVHSLTKSAIFFTVGHATQKAGFAAYYRHPRARDHESDDRLGTDGRDSRDPGHATFGVFASEFLILTTAMKEQPWATPILLLALGVAFRRHLWPRPANGLRRQHGQAAPALASAPPGICAPHLVLMLGIFIPPYLADWYRAAARLIGGH